MAGVLLLSVPPNDEAESVPLVLWLPVEVFLLVAVDVGLLEGCEGFVGFCVGEGLDEGGGEDAGGGADDGHADVDTVTVFESLLPAVVRIET